MKNINKYILSIILILFFSISFTACNDVEDPINPNEEELITTVELTFTNSTNSADVRVFKFADPDGDGGNAPTRLDTIKLTSNSTYKLQVRFLDESDANDVEDITEEVREEANEHLVCYSVTAGTTVNSTDKDGNNLILGLEADVVTTGTSAGVFTISLKHQPKVKNGSCDVGETDVEVAFPVRVD